MKVAFLPIAQRELDDVFSWYEQQAVGLGYEFLDTFDQTLRMVCSYPEINPQVQENIRRCLLNRFPYAVYYGVNEETLNYNRTCSSAWKTGLLDTASERNNLSAPTRQKSTATP